MNTFKDVPQVITALQTVAAKGTEWEAIFNNPQEAIKALKHSLLKRLCRKTCGCTTHRQLGMQFGRCSV